MKKVYLETPEEVIKALKEGKEIYDVNNYSHKLIDGIIVAKKDNEYHAICDCIYLEYKPYILEEEPLKIEVGEWYETRDHRKARCYCIDRWAYFTIDNNCHFCLDTQGRDCDGKTSDLDIIGPWKEDK